MRRASRSRRPHPSVRVRPRPGGSERRPRGSGPPVDDRGQVLPLVALVVVLAAVLVLALGRIGGVVVDRAQARSAADAAALAAASTGDAEAVAVAEGSGGRVVSIERDGAEVSVTVQVGDARATSRARPSP